MASKTTNSSRDVTAELAYLTRALKAPTLREAIDRLAERARTETWSYEEFLAACLQREVSARESHGGEGRIRSARFPSRKSLEEFDFDHARGLKRDLIATSGLWTSWPPKTTSSSSARPGLVNIAHFSYRLCRTVQFGRV
jgi:DNA replication protein DnaC